MAKRNEANTDFLLRTYITTQKEYSNNWFTKKTDNSFIQECLNIASKRNTGERGEPDLIYYNEKKRLLILIENKDSISDHKSKKKNDPIKYAVDGILHYLGFFRADLLLEKKVSTKNYLDGWKIVGIAFSGDINDKYNHLISTFIIKDDDVKEVDINEILNESDYLALFENIDIERITGEVSKSSAEINRLLRNIDSQKRPILLSALMISLYEKDGEVNPFKRSYIHSDSSYIADSVPIAVKDILKKERIPDDKVEILINELAFLKTDIGLRDSDVLKKILNELNNEVIPLFQTKTNYDIIGKFYEEFLRYAGVSNVKKGIVLTPHHITKLFTELIDLKTSDVIFDACCGTGAFLIAGMNRLIDEIDSSGVKDRKKRIEVIKENQLIGFESSSTMYSLAISNMLFRGDGKSRIFYTDFFSEDADQILIDLREKGIKPTIGFINPPYGGKDNKNNPTKKEIQFLEKLLDNVSRYGIIIAPLSTYFNDEDIRNRILSNHSLKYVINMPSELFMPNAATNTAIAVIETNIPHGNKNVVLYSLTDDGFVLSKNKGRTDNYNKWNQIKRNLLKKIKNADNFLDGINLVKTPIVNNNEWIIQAHSKIDYSVLDKDDFVKNVKENILFYTKKELNLLETKLSEFELLEILHETKIFEQKRVKKEDFGFNIDFSKWQEFSLYGKPDSIFEIKKGERLVEADRGGFGDTPLVTASSYNNGITSFINHESFKNNKKIYKNKITIDMFCNVFYHDYDYFSDDNVHTLIFNDEEQNDLYTNKYVMIFILTCIKQLKTKFDYGRQVRLKRLETESIMLPADSLGNPDWKFIEEFMKKLPHTDKL